MEKRYDILELLEYIDPSVLSYEEWLQVGMGLKEDGHDAEEWERWSSRDACRYHDGECRKKWNSFNGSTASNITAGTIVQMAKNHGWHAPEGTELSWDDVIGGHEDLVVVDRGWLEGEEISEPRKWEPAKELAKYIDCLFEASENVGYVTECYEKDGRYLPKKGCWDRTAGKLVEQLSKCGDDIGAVIGDYNEKAGAWIRFNPLDGKGIKNDNVTDFRYALVESDTMTIEEQNAIIRQLELPVACLVYSGGKSLHAIVKIDAGDYGEYRKRVDFLYEICNKNGLKIDTQNKNPSRLSRMPGIIRNGRKQFLVDTDIGREDWKEWREWIESVNDDLPDPESLTSVWDSLPELSPPLIDGILRQGHKMLLAGPSKAGKSYALIELAIAIAEGKNWLNWKCTRGKVLYVNLELDRASCLHRFKDVYGALKLAPSNLGNIDIWNLRGKSVPMDKLAPKLIRRAARKDYIAIIIDPIYKVITGDENSADQMAHFCNQFDLVCNDLGAAVIYCHHHSKGGQGQKKSMDRASGSGVFARDPDALLDLIELELTEDVRKQKENEAVCAACIDVLDRYSKTWEDHVSQDDMCSAVQMQRACDNYLLGKDRQEAERAVRDARKSAEGLTAWRLEGTLREFPKFAPVNAWFDYPVHRIDDTGMLKDVDADGEQPYWKQNLKKSGKRNKSPEERKKERSEALSMAYEACSIGEQVTVKDLSEYMGKSEDTVRRYIKETGQYWVDGSEVGRK
jgi:RecA-family ATPase